MDTYHGSHGDAQILSLEQDSPYLGFCCRRQMEFLTKTLFSTIPSCGGLRFDHFRLRFLEFSTKDSSSCVPVVVYSDFPFDS